jgi:hypothetical protein
VRLSTPPTPNPADFRDESRIAHNFAVSIKLVRVLMARELVNACKRSRQRAVGGQNFARETHADDHVCAGELIRLSENNAQAGPGGGGIGLNGEASPSISRCNPNLTAENGFTFGGPTQIAVFKRPQPEVSPITQNL